MYKLEKGMELNLVLKMKDGSLRREHLYFEHNYNYNNYTHYLRCFDYEGTKGLQSWTNRTWESYFGQTALNNWLSKKSKELDADFAELLREVISKHELLRIRRHVITTQELAEIKDQGLDKIHELAMLDD